eukprot:5990958-Pleurochrysis_carterae.AAC.1
MSAKVRIGASGTPSLVSTRSVATSRSRRHSRAARPPGRSRSQSSALRPPPSDPAPAGRATA